MKLDIEAVPHSALGDILVLEGLFRRILAHFESRGDGDPADQMLQVSNAPVMIARMPFGKHKRKKMDQVPKDYLKWLLTSDIDEDLARRDFTVNGLFLEPSDFNISLDGAILGKPADPADAERMIARLSGREHTVHIQEQEFDMFEFVSNHKLIFK